ncbi:MAG: efflux RND transporter periplasmic adaptor subunit, partial [Gemmatimonadaceae bacterium]
STELFMEHPALIVGNRGVFAVHLTDVTDFAPLRSGPITLRFQPRSGGAPLEVVQEEPRAPGIYGPAPAFVNPGVYDLTIIVRSPQARDSISVPGLTVYATEAEAPREEAGGESGIRFLKEQQWKTPGFRTAFAAEGRVAETFVATGEVIAAGGRLAEVTAPIAGMVDASGVANAPAVGVRVTRGQVLVRLVPALGEGGSAYAEARARLREAEDEHARATRLLAAQAIPERRMHEAESRLRAAREALAGLNGGALTANGRIELRAPNSGVVTVRSVTPGSRVEAGAALFTIVDPSVVWLRTDVPAARATSVRATNAAEFRIEGSTRIYRTGRAISLGSVIDPLSRTVAVLHEVTNPDRSLRIGAIATVSLPTGLQGSGVVIPSDAVLDEDGRAIAYVQSTGEAFERRQLVIGGIAGGSALVISGIAVGERVVTGAAYQVRLASLSSAVPAEGHAH